MLVKSEKNLDEVSSDMFNLWIKRVGIVFRKTVYSTPVIGLICIFAQLVNLIRQILTPKGIILSLVILFFIDIQEPLVRFIGYKLEYNGSSLSLEAQLEIAENKLKNFKEYHEKVNAFDEARGWEDRSDDSFRGIYRPNSEYLDRISTMRELENSIEELKIKIESFKNRK